jgi:hypothetical protein
MPETEIPRATRVDIYSIGGRMSKKFDIKALADYAVSEGAQNSENGQWETSYEELYNHFGVEIALNDEACKELAEEIRKRRGVTDLTITEDGIEVTYDTLFCKNLTAEGVAPILERYPVLRGYVVEMARLAERYAKQAVDCQLDGIGRIRFKDVEYGAFHENFDEELFLDMLLDRPEIEEIDSDFEGYDVTIAESYRPQEQSLRELDDDVEVMCTKHVLWLNDKGGEQANFSNCLIKGVDLSKKNLMNAILDGARFVEVKLKDASLCFSSFNGTKFYDCNMTKATAEECEFKDAKFIRTDTEWVAFTHSNMRGAQFIDCDMRNTILQNCCIENTDLGNAYRGAMHMDGTSDNEQEWLGDTGEIKMKM